MQKREKVLIIATIILLLFMITKSLWMDEVNPKTEDEIKFKSFVEKRIEDGKEELGILNKIGLSSFKVVRIEKLSDKLSEISYYVPQEDTFKEGTIKGEYRAKVRGYILYIIPYREFSVEVGQ